VNVFVQKAIEYFDEKGHSNKDVENTNSNKAALNWKTTAARKMLDFFLLTVADAAAAHLLLNSGFFFFFFLLFLLNERLFLGVFSRSFFAFSWGFFATFFLIFFHCGM
jgi:hypothetical protein